MANTGAEIKLPLEESIEQELLEAQSLVGSLMSVHRSTGGRINVKILEAVVRARGTHGSKPVVALKVKFKDLRLTTGQQIAGAETVTFHKLVKPEELSPAFANSPAQVREQRFGLDLGVGAIPVRVIETIDEKAYFLEVKDIEKAVTGGGAKKASIPIYEVDARALRWLDTTQPPTGRSEWDTAISRYAKLLAEDRPAVSEILRFGKPLEVPTGVSAADLEHYLRICIQNRRQGKEDPTMLVSRDKTESGLIPFGILEG